MTTRIENMPEDVYHTSTGLGSTAVKTAYDSPKAFGEYIDRPDYMRRKTASLSLGSLVHRMILEPARFEAEYVFADKAFPNYTLKAAKDYLAELAANNPGKTIIKVEEAYELQKIREACDAIPMLKKLLGDGLKTEVSYFAQREYYLGKARFDIENANVEMFGDLKTTSELTMDTVQRTMIKYSYDIQMAHYLDVVNPERAGWPFVFVFVETSPPYKACIVVPSEDFVSYAQKRLAVCKHNIKLYMQGSRDPDFPEIMQIRQPEWAVIKSIGV